MSRTQTGNAKNSGVWSKMLRMVESERFEMRISRELLALIDAWAKAQPDNPPRATAFKRLVTMALEAEERKAARGKK